MPSELPIYYQGKELRKKWRWVRDQVAVWLEETEDSLAKVELDFDLNDYFDWSKLEEDLRVKAAKRFDEIVEESKTDEIEMKDLQLTFHCK